MRLTPGTSLRARALLFDMDGTLVDSTPVVHRVWTAWAKRHGLDPALVLRVSHGRRVVESVQAFAHSGLDVEREIQALVAAEAADIEGVVEIAGARRVLESTPVGRWGVVTSAERLLARTRIAAAGLLVPDVLVTAEDVATGKPNPEGYRLGAARLGVHPSDCIVFEDAPAGLRAGHASGARVVALATTLPVEQLAEEDWIADWQVITIHTEGDGIVVSITG